MWICFVFVIALGRVYPFTTRSDLGTETETADLSPDNSFTTTNEPVYSTVETTVVAEAELENSSEESSYVVAILHRNNYLLGTGVIVGEKWILVTAFQTGAFKSDQLTVRVGSSSALSGGQLLEVDKVFLHPMFKEFNNDVALLKTAGDIVLNDSAKMIPVAESPPGIGDGAILWMWDDDTNVQKNQADILPVSECRAFYPDFELTDSNICAVLDHVLPFQVGLYGSPLVYNGSLVGLYMGMEANVFKPSLCSNLSPLVGWVQAMMINETTTQLLFPLDN